jgi:hypothetical protein
MKRGQKPPEAADHVEAAAADATIIPATRASLANPAGNTGELIAQPALEEQAARSYTLQAKLLLPAGSGCYSPAGAVHVPAAWCLLSPYFRAVQNHLFVFPNKKGRIPRFGTRPVGAY